MADLSPACCTIPPAEHDGTYTPKGSYETLNGLKTYITGPHDATKAIFFIYDIFGFVPPTLQGADILSSQGYLVIIPDFHNGEPARREWSGSADEGHKQAFAEWRKKLGTHDQHVPRVYGVLEEARGRFADVKRWGVIGYCWGGKVVALTSGKDTPWAVAVQSSPSSVNPEDAKQVSIPLAVLASKNEPAEAVKEFGENLTGPKYVETFETQVHGWMSARADLKDEEVRKEYERGYQVALGWFGKYL